MTLNIYAQNKVIATYSDPNDIHLIEYFPGPKGRIEITTTDGNYNYTKRQYPGNINNRDVARTKKEFDDWKQEENQILKQMYLKPNIDKTVEQVIKTLIKNGTLSVTPKVHKTPPMNLPPYIPE